MRGFSFPRRRKNRGGGGDSPTWQDTVPSRDSGPSQGRYVHIPQIDRWRAVPFVMLPAPERGAVMEQVQQLTQSLDGAIDEGTGASLDLLIESWTGAWIATVESEYVDHCAVISIHRGQARQWLTEADVNVEHEREKLDQSRSDYLASRQRLTGESPDPASSGAPQGTTGVPDPGNGGGPGAPTAEATAPGAGSGPSHEARSGPGPAPRQDWTAPHLVAGRSMVGLFVAAFLILIGALADTIAFHNVLDLILKTEQDPLVWAMATGTTSMALTAAGSLGVARAIRRRGRHWAPRHRPSRLPLVVSALVWLGLGLAMFLIRWLGPPTSVNLSFTATSTSTPTPPHQTLLTAIFFGAIYLVSGAVTMFEAERLYNPEYFAFRRLRKQYSEQAKRVAKVEAEKDRAESALELHDGELQREDQRRLAAIADRKALAAEAANYARVLMASMMRDPAKTGITETGPVPEMPSPPGAGPAAAAAGAGAGAGGPSAGGAASAP